MAETVLVDTGFLVALLARRDGHHHWAVTQARQSATPWHTCEGVVSETYHLLGPGNASGLSGLLRRRAVIVTFNFIRNREPVLKLLTKYADVPMSFADACLVRMTEMIGDCVLLTTDNDFRTYRRHGRQVVPCITPE